MVRIVLVALCLNCVIPQVFAQKVKYKDLFVLLNAKQYDQAEPFLRKYLAENDDNPNAFLFMGIIFQEKATANDVLKETDILQNNLDSALLFYDKAYKGLNEKEIKKNDEYYQAYNRRDLRTGKFGVKLSDVQFDVEKKIEALKARKQLVKDLRSNFDAAESLYLKTQSLYKDLQIKYGNVKSLSLRSDATTINELKRIASVFDSSATGFKNYKSVSGKIGKTGYNQEWTLMEIKDLTKDGTSPADFMQTVLEVWDYKKWAESMVTNIETDIAPLRDQLVARDIEINKLREKIKEDSISVKSDLVKLGDTKLYTQLKKYDPDPLPIDVFGMKIAELAYLSQLIEHKPFRDSANVSFQISSIRVELKEISKLDSVTEKLSTRNFDEDAIDYNHFITSAYGTPSVLKSLVKTTKDFSSREKSRKHDELAVYEKALKWMVTTTDSIPLFTEGLEKNKFRPLIVVEDKFTSGFKFADSTAATGYFTTINPSRTGGIEVTFPVDKKSFTFRKLPVTKALYAADANGQVFYMLFYSEEKVADKFPVTLAKIYKTDGLAWSTNFSFELLPAELSFAVESGEVSVKTSNPAGESKMIFIDKNGKLKVTPK